jgi:hypothetical protein
MSALAALGALSDKGTIDPNATLAMRASNLAFGTILPQYKWMCKNAGGEFNANGYCLVGHAAGSNYRPNAPRFPNNRGACDVAVDPTCPDYTYEGTFLDDRTQTLPYTVQDTYDRAQTPTDVPVLTLSNSRLRATITPQWGGRVWGLDALDSAGKEEYGLVYKNRYFQPNSDALRQAYTQGGIEWNFGTQIGHMSQTQDPMWAARLPTERGDVLRVWTYERISGAVWQARPCRRMRVAVASRARLRTGQVDNLLQGGALYAHIKITPVVEDLTSAYWCRPLTAFLTRASS